MARCARSFGKAFVGVPDRGFKMRILGRVKGVEWGVSRHLAYRLSIRSYLHKTERGPDEIGASLPREGCRPHGPAEPATSREFPSRYRSSVG